MGVFRQQGEMGVEAKQVLEDNLGSRLSELEDIMDYLISIVEESSNDLDESVETLASMLEGAVDEDTAIVSRKIIEHYNSSNELHSSKDTSRQLLDAPINVGAQQMEKEARNWVKQADQVSHVDRDALERAAKKKKSRQEKKARREEQKYMEKMAKEGVETIGFQRSVIDTGGGSRDIKLDYFSLSYGRTQLLVDATLSIVQGRKYGLVGRNGSGKSTLLRHISSRELPIPKNISVLHVEQEVVGDETTVLRSVLEADLELVELWREEKALLEKDPENLRLPVIYKRLNEIDAVTAEARASAILAGLSFDQEMQVRPTSEYSGGWRMRIALARALFCHPDLLLLDEPTNHLDFHAIVWLERFLEGWEGTIIIVSHQREFLNLVCTDIAHLHQKTITQYRGNYDNFEKAANEHLKQMSRALDAQVAQRKHIQAFIDRFRVNANRAAMVQSRIKKLQRMAEISPMVEEDSVDLPFLSPSPISPPILQLEDCEFRYHQDAPILFKDVNLGVDMDSRVALVGANGSGKSTLLKLLTGELSADKGSVYRNGALRFSTFSQHFVDQLDLNLSTLEYFNTIHPKMSSQDIRSHVGKYGIVGDIALRSIRTLSGGQKSRVVFAKIALDRPHILLLDEPSNHLDIETIEGLARSLATFEGGVLMVSHDQRLIELVCDEIWNLENNEVKVWPGNMKSYKKHITDQMDSRM